MVAYGADWGGLSFGLNPPREELNRRVGKAAKNRLILD